MRLGKGTFFSRRINVYIRWDPLPSTRDAVRPRWLPWVLRWLVCECPGAGQKNEEPLCTPTAQAGRSGSDGSILPGHPHQLGVRSGFPRKSIASSCLVSISGNYDGQVIAFLRLNFALRKSGARVSLSPHVALWLWSTTFLPTHHRELVCVLRFYLWTREQSLIPVSFCFGSNGSGFKIGTQIRDPSSKDTFKWFRILCFLISGIKQTYQFEGSRGKSIYENGEAYKEHCPCLAFLPVT